jgi:hypothetical protein
MYSPNLYLTSTLERDGCCTPRPACFSPGKTRYLLYGWATRPVWASKAYSLSPGFDPCTVQPLKQWFPTFFHFRAPLQPISKNCALHVSKIFVSNIIAVISTLYVEVCAFSPPLFNSIHVSRNVLVRTLGGTCPQDANHCVRE